VALLVLAGCAQPPRPPASAQDTWSGRLALQVEDPSAQSFSASFDLRGSPETGELSLYSPFGSVLARLTWARNMARLEQDGAVRQSPSLEDLLQELTGSRLPVAALFDWLQGHAAAAEGWHADLGAASQGRVVAQRLQPLPRATLRIVLDR